MMHFDGCIDDSASGKHCILFVNVLIRLGQHDLKSVNRRNSLNEQRKYLSPGSILVNPVSSGVYVSRCSPHLQMTWEGHNE